LSILHTAAKFGAYGKICSIAFVISIIDALETCAALPSLIQFATVFHLPASSIALPLSPSTLISLSESSTSSMDRPRRPDAIYPSPKKILDLLGRQSSTSRVYTNDWDRTRQKALLNNDLPSEFVNWREIAADRNQPRAVFDSKMPSATKETPKSSRKAS
jgi:hypothetical protein